jgi:hypothetical protein
MAIGDMTFEEDMSPSATEGVTAKTPEEMDELNSALAAFEPKDILQYLIDQGKLAPETTLLEPEEAEGAEPGMEGAPADNMEDMAEGGGLGGLSFEGM